MENVKRGLPAIHPGEIIKEEYLESFNLKQEELANLLGLSRPVMNKILNGKAPISPKTAVRLAAIFQTSPAYWLNLQSMFDIDTAQQKEAPAIKIIEKAFNSQPTRKLVDTHGTHEKTVFISEIKNDLTIAPQKLKKLIERLSKVDLKTS